MYIDGLHRNPTQRGSSEVRGEETKDRLMRSRGESDSCVDRPPMQLVWALDASLIEIPAMLRADIASLMASKN